MGNLKQDMTQIQKLVGDAFAQTGSLVALADGGQMSPEKLQKALEQTSDHFERSTLELRKLCEAHSPGVGGYPRRGAPPKMEIAGTVEQLGYDWLHIQLNTLLPHCRFQTPAWLTDTICRLLDDYESSGGKLPYFEQAMLVIDEHSAIQGRHVFDQDNKGWKAISNAIKGRLIPDDDQYTLGVILVSAASDISACHITLMDQADAGDFLSLRSGGGDPVGFYEGSWNY